MQTARRKRNVEEEKREEDLDYMRRTGGLVGQGREMVGMGVGV